MSWQPEAKVVLDSVNLLNERIITLEIDLYKLIVAENNTHKRLSRNYQSSRACPVEKVIEQVLNNPVLPLEFGKNKSGMQAEGFLTEGEQYKATQLILELRDKAVEVCRELSSKNGLNLHKQIVNRYLEPWMSCKGVVTATKSAWDAFLLLRDHEDADPQIAYLAKAIRVAIEESTPQQLGWGEWHLPYINDKHKDCTLEEKIKISNACIAQVSYRKLDDSVEKGVNIYDNRLFYPKNGVYHKDGEGNVIPPHYSPAEGIVRAAFNTNRRYQGNLWCDGFVQYRTMLELGSEANHIESTDCWRGL